MSLYTGENVGWKIAMPKCPLCNSNITAKKAGIKFKKIWSNVRTNKFSNPTGDVKKMGKDVENVEMNQWMSDEKSVTKQNYEELLSRAMQEDRERASMKVVPKLRYV